MTERLALPEHAAAGRNEVREQALREQYARLVPEKHPWKADQARLILNMMSADLNTTLIETTHALGRMEKRNFIRSDALMVLRQGKVEKEAEYSKEHRNYEYVVVHPIMVPGYGSYSETKPRKACCVIAARQRNEARSLPSKIILVTMMWQDEPRDKR